MSELGSSLLIVGHPSPQKLMVGGDFAVDYSEAMSLAKSTNYRAVVLPLVSSLKTVHAMLDQINQSNPQVVLIFVQLENPLAPYDTVFQSFEIFRMAQGFDDPSLRDFVVEALEKARSIDQNEELAKLVKHQNRKLLELQIQLEGRIEKRQKFLEDSKKKLNATNNRVEALHRALVAIHRSNSIAEMESLLTEALQDALKLSWIRIIFDSQKNLKAKFNQSRRLVTLFNTVLSKEQDILGDVYFARPLESPFSRIERDFLRQIGDTISIALDRIVKLEELETLQQQWEVTFNAISSPLCIINENREIIQTNTSFEQQTGLSGEALVGEKCYTALFDRTLPCSGCKLGKSFEMGTVTSALDREFEFKVQSYKIRASETIFVNLYQDQKPQRALERRILQSTKMVEIGTIGSSIAHELNNPIGGIINYLQLIKSETNTSHPFYQDLAEMETGAQRCKEIVQNLLSFTRKPEIGQTQDVDIVDVLNRATRIVELQARSRGVLVNIDIKDALVIVPGQRNLLIQAVTNLLQNALDAIDEKKSRDKTYRGSINISHSTVQEQEKIVIEDNGAGITKENLPRVLNPLFTTKNPNQHSGLGLTLSYQIISELGGDLEITSEKNKGTRVVVILLKGDESV